MTDVTDLKQVKVSKITLGLILSVAVTSGVVVWNAASIAGRIDDLEKQVQVIEGNTGTDSTVLAKLDEISTGVLENSSSIDNLTAARLDDLSRFTPSLITEAIASDLKEVKGMVNSLDTSWVTTELDVVWHEIDTIMMATANVLNRIDLAEEAIKSKAWGEKFYDNNE